MRRVIPALAVAAALALLATPVHARMYPSTSGLTVSESTVSPGESIVVADRGANPGATVTIILNRAAVSTRDGGHRGFAAPPPLARTVAFRSLPQGGITLGSPTAAGDGSFRASVTVPARTGPGVYRLIAVSGESVLGVIVLRVVVATDVANGGLASTSADVVPGLAIGAGLIVAGGLLLLSVRHRRSSIA
jgi:hypothetical protein